LHEARRYSEDIRRGRPFGSALAMRRQARSPRSYKRIDAVSFLQPSFL
jgi:hypothetical protein